MPASTTTTTVTHPDGSTVSVTTECEEGSGLKEGFENRLDAVCEGIISNGTCAIPGLVVMARKGQDTYHKNFGMADKEKGTPMELDAQFRCFSMTKVFAAAVALQFKEAGLLDFEAPVETYLPSFAREFEVLTEAQEDEAGAQEIPYTSFLTGETTTLRYTKAKAKSKLLVKHCLAESSGISYEMFTDFELWLKAPIFGQSYAAANALRRRAGKGYYTSNTIIGQACTLAEYCDAIAEAGFLTVEPGTVSYGLGALVVGRILEVLHERQSGSFLRFASICEQKLFAPLGMSSAAFYLEDDDPRIAKIPQLYGAVLRDPADGGASGADVKPYVECLPALEDFPNTVATDNYSGPRSCDSGDTGSTMTTADYAKFYEMLLADGLASDGTRVLSSQAVRELTYGRFDGINRQSKLAQAFQLTGEKASFNYGWAVEAKTATAPHCNFWSGYAHNHGRCYIEDDAYLLIFTQFMISSPGGFLLGEATVRQPVIDAFLAEWA